MIKKYLFSTSLHDQRKIYETFGENRLHFRTVKIKFYTEKAGINANNAKIAFLKYCSMNNSPLMYTIFLAQSLNTKVAYIVQLDC